jgi:hypothetical protein
MISCKKKAYDAILKTEERLELVKGRLGRNSRVTRVKLHFHQKWID